MNQQASERFSGSQRRTASRSHRRGSQPAAPSEWKGIPAKQLAAGSASASPASRSSCPTSPRQASSTERKRSAFAPASGACRTIWLGDHKPQIPYGLETLKLGGQRCFLTEGESDSWALRLAYQRTPVLGIPGASSWQREWAQLLDRFDAVYMSFDGDDAGRQLTDRVWADLAAKLGECGCSEDLTPGTCCSDTARPSSRRCSETLTTGTRSEPHGEGAAVKPKRNRPSLKQAAMAKLGIARWSFAGLRLSRRRRCRGSGGP